MPTHRTVILKLCTFGISQSEGGRVERKGDWGPEGEGGRGERD